MPPLRLNIRRALTGQVDRWKNKNHKTYVQYIYFIKIYFIHALNPPETEINTSTSFMVF